MDNKEAMEMAACVKEKDELKIHFVYMFVIFTIFSAFLMADKWTGEKNFTEYLTNIATFVSVVLGLVAIFYSFISNSSLSQSLGSISKVSDEVSLARVEVGKVIEHAVQLEASADLSAKTLQSVSNSIDKRIESLNETLVQIAEKTEILHSSMESIPERFDKLESRISDSEKPAARPPEVHPEGPKYTPQAVRDFIRYSSVNGLFLMYACLLSYKNKADFSIKAVSEIIGSSGDYLYGYLVAVVCVDLIDKEDNKNSARVTRITRMHEVLVGELKEYIENNINKKWIDRKDSYLQRMRAIEELFSEKG